MEASMELWNMFSTDMDEGEDDYLVDQISNHYGGGKNNMGGAKNNFDQNDGDFDPTCLLIHSLGEDADNDSSFNLKNQRGIQNASPFLNRTIERLPDGTLINFDLAIAYICPACGVEYDSQEVWKLHMNQVHRYNSREGLNFKQLDKTYHQCRQCDKKIAMYSMENLLKHKFTHLPHRCTKCRICDRQYKYRQDLMVHLRIQHYEEIIKMSKEHTNNVDTTSSNSTPNLQLSKSLAIKEIQGGAHEIFDKTDEVSVRNEIIDDDDLDDNDADSDSDINNGPTQKKIKLVPPTYVEDSRSSQSSSRQGNDNDDSLDNYIQYLCPQCALECETFAQWREHIEVIHDFGNRKGLCFQEINMGKQIQCLECNQVLYDTSLRSMQEHKFTHLAYPAWLVCKVCCVKFIESQKIVQHLKQRHHLEGSFPDYDNEDSQDKNLYDGDENDDTLYSEQDQSQVKNEERDIYDPHINYICPQCGLEIFHRKDWRKHIVEEHQLGDIYVLNFSVTSDKQLKCNECGKIITNAYGVQNAQQHRITHMPFKAITKCRVCGKAYTDRKGLVKHLRSVHFIGYNEDSNTSVFGNSNTNSNSNGSFQFNTPILTAGNTTITLKTKRSLQVQKLISKEKKKQCVRYGNQVFEITYLDDEDDDDNYDDENTNNSNSIYENDESVPEMNFIGDNRDSSCNKHECSDCGSLFPTKGSLIRHMKEEHELTEYHNLKPIKLKANSISSKLKNAIDDDSLLILPNGSDNDIMKPRSRTTRQSGVRPFSNVPNEVFEKHISYVCPACGHELKTQVEWRRHINEIHNFDKREFLNFKQIDNQHYQCSECDDLITNNAKLKSLQDHHIRHLPYKLYIKCLICFTRYNHKPNMISHLKVRHNINDNRMFNIESSNEMKNSVPTSSRAASVRSSSNNHSRIPSSNNNPLINYNRVDRPTGLSTIEDSISFHNAVDLDFITYFCPQCNENFDSHVFWRKHIVEHHNLATREGLNFRQLDNHHYLCLECYKRVTVTHTKGAIGQLQSHKFRHLPYRSFKCLTCGNGFVRKQMFFKHLNRDTMRCVNNQNPESTSTSEATSPNATPYSTPQHTDDNEYNDLDFNSSLGDVVQQCHFTLVCPQCGEQFDTQQPYREHINIVHGLNKRNTLNISKIGPQLHQCMECGDHIKGNKLRALQAHKFKHLPHGPYLQCKYCNAGYNHIRNMQDHLTKKHGHLLHKNNEEEEIEEPVQPTSEEPTIIEDDDDENENENENENEIEEPETVLGGTEDYNEETLMDYDEEQYLLG